MRALISANLTRRYSKLMIFALAEDEKAPVRFSSFPLHLPLIPPRLNVERCFVCVYLASLQLVVECIFFINTFHNLPHEEPDTAYYFLVRNSNIK